VYVPEAIRAEILIILVPYYYVDNFAAEFPRCQNWGIWVHVQTNYEVGDETELHDGAHFPRQVQSVHGWSLVKFKKKEFVAAIGDEDVKEPDRVENWDAWTVHEDRE
jgi:hypothetical protein